MCIQIIMCLAYSAESLSHVILRFASTLENNFPAQPPSSRDGNCCENDGFDFHLTPPPAGVSRHDYTIKYCPCRHHRRTPNVKWEIFPWHSVTSYKRNIRTSAAQKMFYECEITSLASRVLFLLFCVCFRIQLFSSYMLALREGWSEREMKYWVKEEFNLEGNPKKFSHFCVALTFSSTMLALTLPT